METEADSQTGEYGNTGYSKGSEKDQNGGEKGERESKEVVQELKRANGS